MARVSPVSRGRKPKKSKNASKNNKNAGRNNKNRKTGRDATTGRSAELWPGGGSEERAGSGATLGSGQRVASEVMKMLTALAGPVERPPWFDAATAVVVEGGGSVLLATGPRELEQATTELLGAQVCRTVRDEERLGLDEWFAEVTEALADRVADELGRGGDGWPGPWWVLHGLTSIGAPELARGARDAVRRLARGVAAAEHADAELAQPGWLADLAEIAATGEVWQLRDGYGSRFGVIAGFAYPGSVGPSVFLFDLDASGFVELLNAGAYDDVSEAAAAWRAIVGDTADAATPSVVESPDRLECFVHWDDGEQLIRRDFSDAALVNWYRARRRVDDLATALRARGMSLPEHRSRYQDRGVLAATDAFTAWYLGRHGEEPHRDAAKALAEEWLEGSLFGTEHAASPDRVRYQLELIGDWKPEDPVVIAAKALLPEWVRWNGEQGGLPDDLVTWSVDVAVAGLTEPPEAAAD